MLLYHTKRQSRKSEIILSNIYRILSKVNRVIYTDLSPFYDFVNKMSEELLELGL